VPFAGERYNTLVAVAPEGGSPETQFELSSESAASAKSPSLCADLCLSNVGLHPFQLGLVGPEELQMGPAHAGRVGHRVGCQMESRPGRQRVEQTGIERLQVRDVMS
jgi:hypothetical protein